MKKIVSLLIATILLSCIFLSCSSSSNDPIDLAHQLDEKDHNVRVCVDDEEIEEIADAFETRSKGIRCVIVAIPNNGEDGEEMGLFVYCDSTSVAEDLIKDLEDYVDKNNDFRDNIERVIVEQSEKIVFVGCEDVWEAIQ